jgi:protein-S-isoprenylcysteine O-methyltransferase Ste14
MNDWTWQFYSGLLIMALGANIWFGQAAGLVIFAAILLSLWVKARQEEQLLTRQFPEAYPRYRARVKALIPHVL